MELAYAFHVDDAIDADDAAAFATLFHNSIRISDESFRICVPDLVRRLRFINGMGSLQRAPFVDRARHDTSST